MKKLLLVLSLVILFFSLVHADVYIKTKSHTDAFEMMGRKQPAKDEVNEQWIGKNKYALISSAQNMIIDLDKKVMYIIYNQTKSYIETKLPLDLTKLIPDQYASMLSMIKVTAKVNPNNQTKTIGKWKCSGYDVELNIQAMMAMTLKMKVWASTDVPFDWKTYVQKMQPAIMKARSAQMPFGDDVVEEFLKIKGIQIASETTMNIMGANMRVTTEVQDISKKPAPAGIYEVPAGYKKQDKLTLRQGF